MSLIDVKAELEKARKRLLDLTLSNRLLNYRSSQTRTIELPHDAPDRIYERLVEQERDFRFRPRPEEPSLLPVNEPEGMRGEPLVEDLDEQQGEPGVAQNTLVTDLPSEKLERVLRSIQSHARSTIEEQGVNYLYVALGMLEWRQSAQSEDWLLAPLILIPVEIQREFNARRSRYELRMSHNGEDVESNLCLAEKLRRDFDIELPDLPDFKEDNPEDYFQAVEEVLAGTADWRVIRQAAIGFFSFRKLLVFRDLAPENWEGHKDLAGHRLLRSVFEGQARQGGDPIFLSDYHIDEHKTAQAIPLIADADSSQHSAIVDIMEGHDLVIEGPPGTGKSQTITNAIAAAIHEGKTVLFVSEKLAALRVVRDMLAKRRLDGFCLDLHGDSATPAKVVAQVQARLKEGSAKPWELVKVGKKLEAQKRRLAAYLEATAKKLGPRGETVSDVFWHAAEFRSRRVPRLPGLKIPPEAVGDQLDAMIAALKELATHAEEIGAPSEHAWRWFACPDLIDVDQEEVIRVLRDWLAAAEDFCRSMTPLCTMTTTQPAEWESLWRDVAPSALGVLASGDGLQDKDCFACCTAPKREVARRLIQGVEAYRTAEADAQRITADSPEAAYECALRVVALKSKPAFQRIGGLKLSELRSASVELRNLTGILADIAQATCTLRENGYPVGPRLSELRRTIRLHELMTNPAIQRADDLRPAIFLAAAQAEYTRALESHGALTAREEQLSRYFSLIDLPGDDELSEIRKTLRSHAGVMFAFLSGSYRGARRRLRAFARAGIPSDAGSQVLLLEALDKHRQEQRDFARDQRASEALHPWFKGMDTDWAHLEDTLRWVKTAKAEGLGYDDVMRLLAIRDQLEGPSSPRRLPSLLAAAAREMEAEPLVRALTPEIKDDWSTDEMRTVTCALREVVEEVLTSAVTFRTGDATVSQLVSEAERVVSLRQLALSISEDADFRALMGGEFRGPHTDTTGLAAAIAWHEALRAIKLPENAVTWLMATSASQRAAQLRQGLEGLLSGASRWHQAAKAIAGFGQIDESSVSLGNESDPGGMRALRIALRFKDQLLPWAGYSRAAARAEELGLAAFVEAVRTGSLSPAMAAECLELMVYDDCGRRAIRELGPLGSFSRQSHEQLIAEYRELDRQHLHLNAQEIAAIAALRQPPEGVSVGRVKDLTENGLIHHETQKEKQFCKIRDLVSRAGRSLQVLTPCFMMSPFSVAQFLPPGTIEFDLVIMDEASQIKPDDALSAIIRAKQLVVVGDPKQLPPTSFFEKAASSDVDEDDATLVDDTESILEVAMKAFSRMRLLKWHYRSRHESLIAFSNERFYRGELITFPSPNRQGGALGLRYHQVPGGQFVSQCNPVEAEAVAQAIVRHALDHPDESLGIGTFNAKQRDLVEERLEFLCTQDSLARSAVEDLSKGLNGLFIKNLENLQGDERDVVFISYTYGPDPTTGRVFNRFGPITYETGWRRLNVLITRARKRVEVFTSMTPADIIGGPDKKGVNAMKDYLTYAQTGVLVDRGKPTGRDIESPFELAVARAVEGMGLKVRPQVGVAGFFIDLGVLKPDRDDEYILGIECDGASYHSAKSARDRDRLRQEVIEARGWAIHRIWSTDWFQNRTSEEERLRKRLMSLLGRASGQKTVSHDGEERPSQGRPG